jgi:hypothetical protein
VNARTDNPIAAKLRERPYRLAKETEDEAAVRRMREREEGATEIERLTAYTERLLVIIQKHNADCDFHQMPKWKIALATPEGGDRNG